MLHTPRSACAVTVCESNSAAIGGEPELVSKELVFTQPTNCLVQHKVHLTILYQQIVNLKMNLKMYKYNNTHKNSLFHTHQ